MTDTAHQMATDSEEGEFLVLDLSRSAAENVMTTDNDVMLTSYNDMDQAGNSELPLDLTVSKDRPGNDATMSGSAPAGNQDYSLVAQGMSTENELLSPGFSSGLFRRSENSEYSESP